MQNQCKKCVLDRSAKEIIFDENGVCNFCHEAQKALKEIEAEKYKFPKIIEKIKYDGRNNKYDCLIGLSGGVDSSTALHHCIQLGLRPLCFSVDNGWQSDIAQENTMRLVEGLKVPFYRYTIDLKKFRELQMAFIKSGVPNIEIPSDHIILATSLKLASKYRIRWIISGGNVSEESVMPPSFGYSARDLVHIKAIYKFATDKNLTGLPLCSLLKWNYYKWIRGIKTLYLLDFLDYSGKRSIELLQKQYGWKSYHEKHCESIFTHWFQNFYLFEKFGFDKRKAHLSSLINSGQMTRDEALEIIAENPVYPEIGLEKKVMKYPKRSHDEFPKDNYELIAKIIKMIGVWK